MDAWKPSERDFLPKSYPEERRGKGAPMKGSGKGAWERDLMFNAGAMNGIGLDRVNSLKNQHFRDEPAYSVYDKTPELDIGTVASITGQWLNLYGDTPDATPGMHQLTPAWASSLWATSPPSTPIQNLRPTPPTTPATIRSKQP